jgi:pimeloyl-ACP methyl ester carboxylesterase
VAVLPTSLHAIAIDLRGHGESAWDPNGYYETTSFVKDVEMVLEQFAVKHCVLMGHSMGGNIALRLTLAHPDRVEALVLVDYGSSSKRSSVEVIREAEGASVRRYDSVQEYLFVLQERYCLAQPDALARLARYGLQADNNGLLLRAFDPKILDSARKTGPNLNTDLAQAASLVRCRTLVVRGEASSVFDAQEAQRFVERIAGAELRVVRRAGHAVMIDNPEGFNEAVLPFLGRIRASRPLPGCPWVTRV